MPSVSVIIPTLNRPELLREAIKSVLQQTPPANEIIIVDDGSLPPVDAAKLKTEFGSSIKVLRNEESQGLAWARNQGAMAASSQYVAHMDDDDLFAPKTLGECTSLLEADPALELVFVGVEGFGSDSDYFNKMQPISLARVIKQGKGREVKPDLILFSKNLLEGLINQVPMAFQRVVARREVWERVSKLRLQAYQKVANLPSEAEAMNLIRGQLRDSEWALYAGVVCTKTALYNQPGYLQRCERQGMSSQPANLERHTLQAIKIKTQFFRASLSMQQFKNWKRDIRHSLAKAEFDAA